MKKQRARILSEATPLAKTNSKGLSDFTAYQNLNENDISAINESHENILDEED